MTGPELRVRRARLGLSQEGLGRALGVAPNTIARWERGELAIEHARMLDLALDALDAERGLPPDHHHDRTPLVADVLALMREAGASQEGAVRRLGGEP